MVKYQAKNEKGDVDAENPFMDNYGNWTAGRFAEKYNTRDRDFKCNEHPYIDSVVLIDRKDFGGSVRYEIVTVCCQKFREKLSAFLHIHE